MIPIGALLDIGGKILDKVFPDPAQAEQAKLKLLEMQQMASWQNSMPMLLSNMS